MTISIIAAADRNGIIGSGGKMPWHIKDEMDYFRRVTMGKSVVMGRKTYESIGGPLNGRENFVVSNTLGDGQIFLDNGVTVIGDPEACIEAARGRLEGKEVMIVGGASIYEQTLPLVDRVYLTMIDADHDGDIELPFDVRSLQRKHGFRMTRSVRDRRLEPERPDLYFYTFERE